MQLKDHYKTLRISRQATQEDIKAAYRGLAKKYHPDKNQGNKAAEETFKEIQEAYSILSDPAKKHKYDLKLNYGSQSAQPSNNNSSYSQRERAQQKRGQAQSNRTRTNPDARPESDRQTEFLYKACFAAIVIVLSVMIYGSFRDSPDTRKIKEIVQSSVKPVEKVTASTLSNADSPYDAFFGESVYDTLSLNRVYLYNYGKCAAIVCLVENKAPFRTIRNEFIEPQVKFGLDRIPDGEYFIKIYFGDKWVARGILPDGTMAGRFVDEKGFRIYNSKDMIMKMEQKGEGRLYNFSSYEFHFSVNDSSGTKSLTAEQFFK